MGHYSDHQAASAKKVMVVKSRQGDRSEETPDLAHPFSYNTRDQQGIPEDTAYVRVVSRAKGHKAYTTQSEAHIQATCRAHLASFPKACQRHERIMPIWLDSFTSAAQGEANHAQAT